MRSDAIRMHGRLILFAIAAVALAACAEMRPIVPGPSGALPAQGAASGPFGVRRIELQFPDGRAESTVPRGGVLAARAIVQTQGSGILRGAWLADGQPVGSFTVTVSAGATVTIETGAGTAIPTLMPGPHVLSLRIDDPATALAPPQIRYHVTAMEAPRDAR